MRRYRILFSMLAVLAVLLLVAACGGGAAPAAEEAAPASGRSSGGGSGRRRRSARLKKQLPAKSASEPGKYGEMPADAMPYPDPPELDLGGTMVDRMPIESDRDLQSAGLLQ